METFRAENIRLSLLLFNTMITCSGATWQKFDIFSFTVWLIGFSDRHNIKSGDKPRPLSSRTEDCVGLVLGSPVAFG